MERFTLTNESIGQTVEQVTHFLRGQKLDNKDALRMTLALEEALLCYRDALGEQTQCELKCIRRLGRVRVELAVEGRRLDPFAADDEEAFSQLLLSGLGLAPVWQYKNGQNVIVFAPKRKKPSQLVYILAAVALALVTGWASQYLPSGVQESIMNDFLTPIDDAFRGLLNAVAGVMIFLSVTWSICSIDDMAALTSIGKKMIGRMLVLMAVIPTVFVLCVLPLFELVTGAGAGSIELSEPFSMIIGVVPTGIFSPFIEGNFLQIVFLAAIVGLALLALGSKSSQVVSLVGQLNGVVQLIMEVICSLICLSVFITIYGMVLSGSFASLAEAYKTPLMIVLACLFPDVLYTVWVCVKCKVRPAVFLRKALPSFLIALTTASSSAAMSGAMDTCKKQHGIDDKLVNFGVPLGQTLFGLGSVMEFLMLGFCMAELYGVAITPVWIVTAIFMAVILTIAAPPIAGGGAALLSILFAQLGIPAEALAIAVAIDVIADFLLTSTNVFCRQGELILVSNKLGMLDLERLRSK